VHVVSDTRDMLVRRRELDTAVGKRDLQSFGAREVVGGAVGYEGCDL